MQRLIILVAGIYFAPICFGFDEPDSYTNAASGWEILKTRTDYKLYMNAFIQFNNHFHLDEKDGCYGMPSGAVNLLLVITRPDANSSAVISNAFSDVDNERARCFKRAYIGIKTPAPPYVPFILEMTMGVVAT